MARKPLEIETVEPVDAASAALLGWRRWRVGFFATGCYYGYGSSYYRNYRYPKYTRFIASNEHELTAVLQDNERHIRKFLDHSRDRNGRRQHPVMIRTDNISMVERQLDTTSSSYSVAPSIHFTPRGPMMLTCRNGMVYDENFDSSRLADVTRQVVVT